MKKRCYILLGFLFTSLSYAQTAKDFFIPSDYAVTWLGIDYSHVKLVGDFSQFGGVGEKGPSQLKYQYFPAWNALVINEPEKYSLVRAFRKEGILYDLDVVTAINTATKLEGMEVLNNTPYTKDQVMEMVRSYPLNEGKGFGIVLVAESLNKIAEEAYFYVVVLNLSNKEVLFVEKVRGEPMGFGLRNYWAGSIAGALKSIEKSLYKSWKYKYTGKK